MKIMIKENDNIRIITPEGRIDSTTAPEFSEVLNKVILDNCDIVIDFTDVKYVSSTGLNLLGARQERVGELMEQVKTVSKDQQEQYNRRISKL